VLTKARASTGLLLILFHSRSVLRCSTQQQVKELEARTQILQRQLDEARQAPKASLAEREALLKTTMDECEAIVQKVCELIGQPAES